MINESIGLKTIIEYAVILVGGAMAWGSLQNKVNDHDTKLTQIEQNQQTDERNSYEQKATLVGVAQEVHDMHEWLKGMSREHN